ncbi:MAG: hypothetical protein IPN47_22755 [Gemmatimonadetes bacterium]|nr:hypothetical protein [Gemmatimonadota bacterium]
MGDAPPRPHRATRRPLPATGFPRPLPDAELCTILSAILLGGLLLNALVGWWWADSVAALAMVPLVTIEGVRALRGEPPCGDSCGGACHTEG